MTDTLPTGPFYTAQPPNRELDITERLQLMEGGRVGPYPRDETLRLAIKEIEQLRADLATFGKDTEATENRIIDAEFAATEANHEIERLRTALKTIQDQQRRIAIATDMTRPAMRAAAMETFNDIAAVLAPLEQTAP